MATKTEESLVLVSNSNGIVIIPEKSPLKRLNYFDGKFLRASDLKDEQDYLRNLVRLSNQAGGFGVVHGFDLTLGGGDTIDLGPGLGINGNGRVLLLPQGLSISVEELIEKSLQKAQKKGAQDVSEFFEECVLVAETPPINTTNPSDLYLIVICPAEALCGEEDVYGKLCEEACATSSDRPFAVEGVIVRAVPLVLQTPLPHSKIVPIATKKHLRSRVASAYFEDERHRIASMISKFGLAQEVWCLGADAASGACLPIGVIARAGATTVFLDPWIARRERMDSSPRRYWQWRMMMRPWDVFLAQILQFQCQLRDLFGGDFTPEGQDPCGDAQTVIGEAAQKIAEVVQTFKDANLQLDVSDQAEMFSVKMVELESMSQKLTATGEQMTVVKGNRLLIRGGIIELPSAGYLPVAPKANETVNEQVRRLMGEGVDLRFCVVRPDFVAHALEEAQHMERISLIEGLEDEAKKPKVDILVPDGEVVAETQADTRVVFAADGPLESRLTSFGETQQTPKTVPLPPVPFKGAARSEKLTSGGTAVYLGCASPFPFTPLSKGIDADGWKQLATITNVNTSGQPQLGLWMTLRSDKELVLLKPGEVTNVDAEIAIGFIFRPGTIKTEFRAKLNGPFTVGAPKPPFTVSGTLAGKLSYEGEGIPAKTGNQSFSLSLRQPTSTRIQIVLGVPGKFEFEVDADWSNPAQVKTLTKTTITPKAGPIPKFEMALPLLLSKDPNIFSLSNTNHVGAMAALTIVGAALKEQGFVAEKTKVLFPPPPPAQTANAIRATRDWVLFHRRRTKQCEVVGATRTYQVYEAVIPAGSADNPVPPATPTAAEILNVTAEELKPFVPIGTVSFNAGASTPVGDLAALKAAWKKVPGGSILWAGIASRGDAKNDGDSLAAARLTALESQLDQVDPTARADVLPIVPPPLESSANDGIIVFMVGVRRTYYAYASTFSAIGGKNL
jgi:hypothetical protein